MKTLKEKFVKNELPYTLLERNDKVALYGVGGTYTKEFTHYEVCEIHIRDDQYGLREALPSNEQFGIDKSRAINGYNDALKYYAELSHALNKKENSLSM